MNLYFEIHIFASESTIFLIGSFFSGSRIQIIHRNISVHSMVMCICPFFFVCSILLTQNVNGSSIWDLAVIQFNTLSVCFIINIYPALCTLYDHIIICYIIRILTLSVIRINRNHCQNKAQYHCYYCSSKPSLHNLFPSFLIFFLQQMNFYICCMYFHMAL